MRAEQLATALQEFEGLLSAAGAKPAEADLARLVDYLKRNGGRDVNELLAEIRDRLDPASARRLLVAERSRELESAGYDEANFKSVLSAIASDKSLDRDDLLAIAKDYGVIRFSGKSRKSYIESIEKYFYWKVYNRDADEIAKRATPW